MESELNSVQIDKIYYSRGVPLPATISFDGDNLDLKRPTIVLCHGHCRHKNDGLDRLSEHLTKAGFLTMRMDFRGCGSQSVDRYNLYSSQDWCEDLMNAISYLKNLPMVDPERIGVAGISMGACTAVYTTGMDKRIKSTVSMGGIGDCERWMRWVWNKNNGDFDTFERRMEEDSLIAAYTGHSQIIPSLDMYNMSAEDKRNLHKEAFVNSDVSNFVSLASLRSLLPYKPVEKCPYITTPIFFCYGSEDAVVPGDESKYMYEAVASERKRLKCYEGLEHNLPMDPRRDEVFAEITDWFKETL